MQLQTSRGSPAGAELVAAYLAERDIPCPRCGRNLRGVESDRCPQCGYDLRLVLAGSTRLTWPFYAGLFGLAVAATALAGLLLSALFHVNWAQRSIIGVLGLTIVWLQVRLWIEQGEDLERLAAALTYERVALCWLWAGLAVFLLMVL